MKPKTSLTILILVILLLTTGCDALQPAPDNTISASGVVEANQISLASELGGDVLSVLVEEGSPVTIGQELVTFDDILLLTQLAQAEANLAAAQANYELVAANSDLEALSIQQNLDDLDKYADLARAQAQQAIAAAQDAVRDAQRYLTNLESGSREVSLLSARANLVLLKDKLDDLLDDYDKYKNKPENNINRAAFESRLADAQRKYEDGVRLLNNLEGNANEIDLTVAKANLALAQANLAIAEIELAEIQDGPDPNQVALLQAQLKVVQAQLPRIEAQVQAAQANLDAIQVQADKLTITSPIDGIVLYRNVEPGEFVVPGLPILTITTAESLTITVYIPEDRYGKINVGELATVTSDSFPGEVFEAIVTRIADQAEFTPRNVQTEEERRNTVFAIELTVSKGESQLKPGMPVDVVFRE